jgi:hypothetical protein
LPAINRALSEEEAQKLLSIDEAKERDAKMNAAKLWPGSYNVKLLAKAVKERKSFVEFEPYQRFVIRYDSKFDAVFIKPANGAFVPCGYFSYKKLKDALISDELVGSG